MRPERHVPTEEILEEAWILRERGEPVTPQTLRDASKLPMAEETVRALVRDGRLRSANGELEFSPGGEREAREIVRRNRLTSVLLGQLFDLDAAEVENMACELEHVLNPKVTDSLCTLLGHPPHTPDGRRIPPGECCLHQSCDIRPLVRPLTQLDLGAQGRVAFIVPSAMTRLQRLGSMGLVPGGRLRLVQKKPCFAVELGETTVALEEEVAREIFVREA